MHRTRQELDAAVFQLHAALPAWRHACASQSKLEARYRQLFQSVLDSASGEDVPYVFSQLNELAEASGLATLPGHVAGAHPHDVRVEYS